MKGHEPIEWVAQWRDLYNPGADDPL